MLISTVNEAKVSTLIIVPAHNSRKLAEAYMGVTPWSPSENISL